MNYKEKTTSPCIISEYTLIYNTVIIFFYFPLLQDYLILKIVFFYLYKIDLFSNFIIYF